MGLFPTCKELAEKLSRGEYDRAPWHVRLAVRWHLFRCELCARYEEQVRALGDAYRAGVDRSAPQSLLDRLRKNG